jgi:hypothetical protein
MASITKGQVSVRAGAVEFVDLSREPTKAKIVRQGYQVPSVALDLAKVERFVGDLAQVPLGELPRVVSQSVPAGTKVAAGAVVDLVLAPRARIPFAVFDEVHADLVTKQLDAIDGLYANATVKKALLTYASAGEVPQAERAVLTQQFASVGVTVDDQDPTRSFERAVASARGGLTFQG